MSRNKVLTSFCLLLLSTTVEARVLPRSVPSVSAAGLAYLRHLTLPLPYSDQQCIGQYFNSLNPYITGFAYLNLSAYSAESGTINAVNITGPRTTWAGGIVFLDGQGYRGNGIDGWGDPHINLSTNPLFTQNSTGIGSYVLSNDGHPSNRLVGAAGGGSASTIVPYNGSVMTGAINNASASAGSLSISNNQGYYSADRANDANNLIVSKDAANNSFSIASTGLPTVSELIFRTGAAGATFGRATMAELDMGIGRPLTDRSVINLSTYNVLNCLGYIVPIPPAEPKLPSFYQPNDASSILPTKLWRIGPSPTDPSVTATNFALGPLTGAWSRNVDASNTSTWVSTIPGEETIMQTWTMRKQSSLGTSGFQQANLLYPIILDSSGNQVRGEFTTYDKANSFTEATLLRIMGATQQQWQAPLVSSGICAAYPCTTSTTLGAAAEIYVWADANADPATYFPFVAQNGKSFVFHDKFLIPPFVNLRSNIFSIDYEPADDRTQQQALAFLLTITNDIHSFGYRSFLYTNSWDGGNQAHSGISTAIMPDIMANWDFVSNLVWGASTSNNIDAEYEFGLSFMQGSAPSLDFSKIITTFTINTTTDADACTIHGKYLRDHFAGFLIWQDGAPYGGTSQYLAGSTNLKISELLFGHGANPLTCP